MRIRLTVLALVVAGCGRVGPTPPALNPADWKKADVIQDAESLAKEYGANEVAGDAKYKGKTVATMGRVYAVKTTGGGDAAIQFSAGWDSIEGEFDRAYVSEIAPLKNGDMVIVFGRCDGRFLTVKLVKCRLVKIAASDEEKDRWRDGKWMQ